MKKLIFNVDNNIIELLEKKDFFGSEIIMVIVNNKYVGFKNKYFEEDIFQMKKRLISGFGYKELGIYQ